MSPKKKLTDRLGKILFIVLVAGGAVFLVNHLDLSGKAGKVINLIIILSAAMLIFRER